MHSKYARLFAPILVVVVSMIATYTTFWSPGRGGLELGAEQQETAIHKMAMAVPTEMQSLRTLYRTINLVQKRYIDATRIDSRVMFVAAMRAVQGQVAKVLVSEENDELLVRLGTEERRFALGDVTTPWILLQRVKEVFSFWEKALSEDEVDLREVEYAAINGMLQTLDPHSVFLTPDQYRDMKDKTQGKFGGLGISIGIRDGVLTIISPIKGTPAHLAGLRAGDQIHKIDEISTVNITLNDAVGILRGDPGTAVTVYILRKGWQEPRPFEITRAIIKVESLESHLLGGRVGYLQIKDFQSNTPRDIGEQFEKFKQKGIRGLVLDLRGCPGGLLDAAIKVADLFLKTGVIVTTAGQGPTDRDVRRADADGNEPKYPIVVLVSRGSASASEIVAGALKSHDRALLVGERTFGKGSVQVLYDFHDGSALKLTTAQYLTPGDVSIQSVGVVPHVELLPMRADKEMLDLQIETGYRESDLDHHFEDARVSKVEDQPRKRLRYLWTPTARAREATTGPADAGVAPFSGEDEPFKPDFAIELARDLVVKMTRNQSEKINFKGLSKTLEERSKKEEQKLVSALKNLGIDWREGSDTGQASIEATARLVQPDPLEAGTEDALIVSVTNKGTNTTHRLLATSQSDFRPLDDRELAFGRIEPGETLDRELKFRVPKDAIDQTNDVLWSFSSASNKNLDPVALRFSVKALERPRFAYSFQVVDTEGGNGDSRLQPGESVKLVVDVENVGKGAALDAYATLKGLSGKELFMIQGREALKKLEPGERRRSVFAFEIKPTFGEDKARFELVMADVDLRVYSLEKISIPIAQPLEVRPVSKVVSASAGPIQVLSEPDPKASIVAKLPSGTAVDVEAETGSFYRIRLDDIRVGWISNSAVTAEAIGEKRSAELIVNAPPKLIIEELDQVVQSPTISIRGKAVDEARVRDVYIFVGTNKVFFKPNADPTNPGELSFEAELPLDHGLNYVAVVAEETADLDTREVITIRRDGPDGMSYLQPRAPNGEPEPLGVIPTTNSVLID